MRRIGIVVGLGLTILVGACGTGEPVPGGAATIDATGDWQLAAGTVDGIGFALVDGAPITMTVDGAEIRGRVCNHYGGELLVDGRRVRVMLTSMTQMACEGPLMAAEAAFHAALGRIGGATRDGDRLTLTGPGVELTFDRLAPVPLAELVGTDWVLESLVSGDAVSSVAGDPAVLLLDADGTSKGSTGCRTFSGRWVEANGGISHTDLGMDQTECPPDLAAQDGHVVGVLDGFRVAIDGQTLTLTGDRGNGLIYRASD